MISNAIEQSSMKTAQKFHCGRCFAKYAAVDLARNRPKILRNAPILSAAVLLHGG